MQPVPSKFQYFKSLVFENISKYRNEMYGWGTHFGFDYRWIDFILKSKNIGYSTENYFTTRFYIIDYLGHLTMNPLINRQKLVFC